MRQHCRRPARPGTLSGPPMDRILEPEIMDGRDEAVAYARADFSDSNQAFVDRLIGAGFRFTNLLDLGCGPGDVTIRLARAASGAHVTGVDGSQEMLELAREAVRTAGLG